ncbi:hypothetical protein B1748_19950 [Paenibacillus sp. MY03]|uniref:hypothetical protein n=1 Tax=Paenibacillus sp. MY03 TaxID=302980 RepID=UPI000B3CB044|nr:hypothetical protein [Paenibacillus sp. MY03]OUS74858.1 hypothetical protein B1748_19950 [Paenibacillus sp. MY03]
MTKKLLAVRKVDNIQYQIYETEKLHFTEFNDYRGTVCQREVCIKVYGISAVLSIGQEKWRYDAGALSAQNYEVNNLFHRLTGLDLATLEEIRSTIWNEYIEWRKSRHKDPFSKKANQQLRKLIRKQIH